METVDPSSPKRCYQCGTDSPAEQAFCGRCGAPLSFDDYISKKVKEQLAGVVRDRDVVETDLAIKVFDRVCGWMKKIAAVAAVPLAILGVAVAWKLADWSLTVDKAKQAVVDASRTSREQIERSSSLSLQEITKASVAAKETIEKTSAEASRQAQELRRDVLQTKTEVAREAASVKTENRGLALTIGIRQETPAGDDSDAGEARACE